MQTVKRFVSGNKARFKDPELGLELDLVYLTDQIILMGFPAQGLAALYRNDRSEVSTFLKSRHGEKFRVYNFVPLWENAYDPSFFDGRVSRFPFPDHHAPPLSLISLFVTDIAHWLDGDPERIAAIHCKAGKGRTGTMAISYLLSLSYLPRGPAAINNLIRSSKRKEKKRPASILVATEGNRSSVSLPRTGIKIAIDTSSRQDSAASASKDQKDGSDALTTVQTPTALENPATPASASSGPPDPEYLFALHTRQRMKPKFSSKDEWIPRQLERRTSAVGSLLSKASQSSLRSSDGGSGPQSQRASFQRKRLDDNSLAPNSPLAREPITRDSADAEVTGQDGDAGGEGNGNEGDKFEVQPEMFDAVVQATADASGTRKNLSRFSQNQNGTQPPGGEPSESEEDGQNDDIEEKGQLDESGKPRKYGISISSQRRFVGYWFRVLHGQDARAPLEQLPQWQGSHIWGSGLRGQRKATIVQIDLIREQSGKQTSSSKFVDDQLRVHLSRYGDKLVTRLEREEWQVRTGPDALFANGSKDGSPMLTAAASAAAASVSASGDSDRLDDQEKGSTLTKQREQAVERARSFAWGDASSENKYTTFATFKHSGDVAASGPKAPRSGENADEAASTRSLAMFPHKPAAAGLEIDSDRELLVTVFLSKAHSKLPHVTSLASVWLVPCFENVSVEEANDDGKQKFRMRFGKGDLDWRKGVAGVVGIEIVWEV